MARKIDLEIQQLDEAEAPRTPGTVNLRIFTAVNFHVLLLDCHFMAINLYICLHLSFIMDIPNFLTYKNKV